MPQSEISWFDIIIQHLPPWIALFVSFVVWIRTGRKLKRESRIRHIERNLNSAIYVFCNLQKNMYLYWTTQCDNKSSLCAEIALDVKNASRLLKQATDALGVHAPLQLKQVTSRQLRRNVMGPETWNYGDSTKSVFSYDDPQLEIRTNALNEIINQLEQALNKVDQLV